MIPFFALAVREVERGSFWEDSEEHTQNCSILYSICVMLLSYYPIMLMGHCESILGLAVVKRKKKKENGGLTMPH